MKITLTKSTSGNLYDHLGITKQRYEEVMAKTIIMDLSDEYREDTMKRIADEFTVDNETAAALVFFGSFASMSPFQYNITTRSIADKVKMPELDAAIAKAEEDGKIDKPVVITED